MVTFDPSTGTGFVGKGDVQLAFGWNNAQVQVNAAGVTFTYGQIATYDAVCTWTTGEGTRGEQIHNVTHTRTTGINTAVTYDARTHKQIDGFNLTGFGSIGEGGDPVPVVGGACPGNPGTGGVWTSVTLTGSTGGLFVWYNNQSAKLNPIVP
jgi:hypothetical protein